MKTLKAMNPFYYITKKLIKSNFTRLGAPCKMTFAVTYACTFLCKTCNIGKNYLNNPKNILQGQLTHEEIGKIFKNAKPSWLQITGGEPFMRDMYEILNTIVENDSELYAVSTTTNGFATQTIIESVKKILTLKIPRFVVSVSCDGFESDHEDIRGIENSFKKCLETFNELKKLESKNFNTFISYTASPNNMGKLESFIKNMKEKYGIDQKYIHMNLYHNSSHFFSNSNQQKTEEYNEKVLNEIRTYSKYKKGNDFKIAFLEKMYSKFSEEFVNGVKEYETEISDADELRKILIFLDFKKVVTVEKQREYWDCGDLEIALDKIAGLGSFIEVEAKGNFKNTADAKKACLKFLEELGIKNAENLQIKKGCPVLLLEKNNE